MNRGSTVWILPPLLGSYPPTPGFFVLNISYLYSLFASSVSLVVSPCSYVHVHKLKLYSLRNMCKISAGYIRYLRRRALIVSKFDRNYQQKNSCQTGSQSHWEKPIHDSFVESLVLTAIFFQIRDLPKLKYQLLMLSIYDVWWLSPNFSWVKSHKKKDGELPPFIHPELFINSFQCPIFK